MIARIYGTATWKPYVDDTIGAQGRQIASFNGVNHKFFPDEVDDGQFSWQFLSRDGIKVAEILGWAIDGDGDDATVTLTVRVVDEAGFNAFVSDGVAVNRK
jgi:hypothetical protein